VREAGAKTKVDVFPGLPHGFWAALFPDAEYVKDYAAKSDEGFKWLVEQV